MTHILSDACMCTPCLAGALATLPGIQTVSHSDESDVDCRALLVEECDGDAYLTTLSVS